MSIPNYIVVLANHKGNATVNAGGMSIPVRIGNINHQSEYGHSDLCTFECIVVNENEIQFGKMALNSIFGANPEPPARHESPSEYVARMLAKSAAKKPNSSKAATAVNPFEIKKVYFNDPVTVVIWADGTKTIVRCQEGDVYSKETGLALCIAKKALGNKGNFNDVFHKWIPEEEETSDFSTNTAFNEALAKLTEAAVKAGSAIKECAIYDANR